MLTHRLARAACAARAACIACAALISGAAAADGLRPSQPAVLEASPDDIRPDDEAVNAVEAFRRRYEHLRRPSIALYWNRALSDSIAQSLVQRTTVQTAKQDDSSESQSAGVKQGRRQENGTQTTEISSFMPSGPVRTAIEERLELRLRGAFLSTLSEGGLRMLDRSMMVRTTAAQAASAPDVQSNEARALQGKARYVMEVLLVNDAQAPMGIGFDVSVKEVDSAAVVFADYIVAHIPQPSRRRWVAVNGGQGFEREEPRVAFSAEGVGRALGLAVIGRLANSW